MTLPPRTERRRRPLDEALRCWEQAFRNDRITPDEKHRQIVEGREHLRQMRAGDANHADALVCEMLLLRLESALTADPAERLALLEEIERLQARVKAASFAPADVKTQK